MVCSDEWSQNFSTMFWGFFTVLDKTGLKVSCSGIFTIKKSINSIIRISLYNEIFAHIGETGVLLSESHKLY